MPGSTSDVADVPLAEMSDTPSRCTLPAFRLRLCNSTQGFNEELRNRAERAFLQDDEDDPPLGRRKMNRQRLDRETFSHDFKHRLGKNREESAGCNEVVTQHAGVGADNRRREGQSVRVKDLPNIP